MMNCFHCKEGVAAPYDCVMILVPFKMECSYERNIDHYETIDAMQYYAGTSPEIRISLETIGSHCKMFHRTCFLEVAGKKYAP